MSIPARSQAQPCQNCEIGHMVVQRRPYLYLYHNHLLVLPQAECYQCDICGLCEFDEDTGRIARHIMSAACGDSERLKTQVLPQRLEEDHPAHSSPL